MWPFTKKYPRWLFELWVWAKVSTFGLLNFISHIFKLNSTNTMGVFQNVVQLVNDNTDFANDEAEQAVKNRDAALVELQRASLELEQLANGASDDINAVGESIVELANEFGTAFKNLSADQKNRVKATVAGIVTGANETLIERLFNASLDFVGAAQALTETMDTLLATDPGDTGDGDGTDGAAARRRAGR